MAILTVDEILGANDLPEETVEVPEWGGEVVVRGLMRGEAYKARQNARGDDGVVDMLEYDMQVLLFGVIEPALKESHIDALRNKSAGSIERITSKIMALSSVAPTGVVTQEAVDDAEKSFRDGEE